MGHRRGAVGCGGEGVGGWGGGGGEGGVSHCMLHHYSMPHSTTGKKYLTLTYIHGSYAPDSCFPVLIHLD